MTRLARVSRWWWFLALHVMWWALWFALHVEEYPYGLLTLILSLEAIVLSTLILIVANQQAARDRVEARLDRERARHVEHIAEHLDEVHAHQLKILEHIEGVAKHIETLTAHKE